MTDTRTLHNLRELETLASMAPVTERRYRTFTRSARSWAEFASARKLTVDTGLTYTEAQAACRAFNETRTAAQIRRGTKLEFEAT